MSITNAKPNLAREASLFQPRIDSSHKKAQRNTKIIFAPFVLFCGSELSTGMGGAVGVVDGVGGGGRRGVFATEGCD